MSNLPCCRANTHIPRAWIKNTDSPRALNGGLRGLASNRGPDSRPWAVDGPAGAPLLGQPDTLFSTNS